MQHVVPSADGTNLRSFSRDDAEAYISRVKLGLTYNPMELSVFPKIWGQTLGDVVYQAENNHGGYVDIS